MINFNQLRQNLSKTPIESLTNPLVDAVDNKLKTYTHGEQQQWIELLEQLPTIPTESVDFKTSVKIGCSEELDSLLTETQKTRFIDDIKSLHPWRKGPFKLFGININTEWRSDWKWQRLIPHISPLKNRTVLDVGCGNGYHCWRMMGEQAKLVVGIDPSQKFLAQFSIIKKYAPEHAIHLLPIGIEDMPVPNDKKGFDSVFSMGVLYHRKSPINHLYELKNLLTSKGELILETLVIDGDENQVLLPQGRYAQMRNVWFIPSAKALELWLDKCGFCNIRTVDINQTTTQEQRSTDWMTFHSLTNYLDPNDPDKTIEGYPAPKRAIIIAQKP